MDAAGESVFGIGQIMLSTGPGTSKVISPGGGGKLYWRAVSATFANAGTNLRIGVQDLSVGLEDGTFDVYADLVGGTDTLTAGVMGTAMETGTKTIAHGDYVAIGMEMTTRAGADTVSIRNYSSSADALNTYCSIDTGAGPTRQVGLPMFTLQFDDGTIGWLVGAPPVFVEVGTTFGNASTPDEYALLWQQPFPAKAVGIVAILDNVITTDTFDLVLYSDPLGTPIAEKTVTIDPNVIVDTTGDGGVTGLFTSAFDLVKNTTYGVAVKTTSAGTITLSRMQFGTGNGVLRGPTSLGTNWSEGTRSDVTGAFASSTENLPLIGVLLDAFDDAVSASGGLLTHPGMAGGMRA
jgi:hypothetical protein